MQQLSMKEKIVLWNSYENGCKFIGRDSFGFLTLYRNKPRKGMIDWNDGTFNYSEYLSEEASKILKFIKWEDDEPYEIEKLLEGDNNE